MFRQISAWRYQRQGCLHDAAVLTHVTVIQPRPCVPALALQHSVFDAIKGAHGFIPARKQALCVPVWALCVFGGDVGFFALPLLAGFSAALGSFFA